MGSTPEDASREPQPPARSWAWLGLAFFAVALSVSALVQWELYGARYLQSLPLLWGAAAVLGAVAWVISRRALPRGAAPADLEAPRARVLLAPAPSVALVVTAIGLALLYDDPVSGIGGIVWLVGIALLPLGLAWAEGWRPSLGSRAGWGAAAATTALVLVALVVRLYRLDELPAKYLDDEGATADFGLNYLHGTPFFGQHLAHANTLFRNGTTAYPLPGSYIHALVMQVAGETIFGSRLTAAIAGALCIAVVYFLLRDHVRPRAAFLAAALFAFCHTHLYWSRSGISQSMTATTIAALFWLTLRGLRTGSYATFAVAGLLLGLAQYLYEGARFFVLVLALFFLFAAAFDFGLVRRRWRHVLLMAAVSALVFAPIGFWYVENPQELLARSRGVLIFAQPDYLADRYPGLDTTGVVLAQLRRALEGFAFRGDGANFFALRGPILDPVARVLVLTGVLGVIALRHRLRLLVTLWIWVPIAIVCVPTVDPPSMTRLIQVVPALYLVVGLLLDRLFALGAAAAGSAGANLLTAVAAAAVVYGAQWNLSEFFGRYAREYVADAQTIGGLLARSSGPRSKTFILGDVFSFHAPSVRFLARGLAGQNFPTDAVPIPERGHRDGLLIASAADAETLRRLRQAYPNAVEQPHPNAQGEVYFHSFHVPAAMLSAAAGEMAPWRTADARIARKGKRWGELDVPQALAVDGRGNVYAADTGNQRVVVFDAAGVPTLTFGDDPPNEVGPIVDIAVLDDGTILTLSRDPARLRRFGSKGEFLGDIVLDPPPAAPLAIAPAAGGFLLLDTDRAEILRLTADGKVTARVGARGHALGEFDQPTTLASSPGGHVYVFDRGNRRIQRFSPDLRPEAEWPLEVSGERIGHHLAVSMQPDERLLVAVPEAGEVKRFRPDGSRDFPVGEHGDFPGQLAWPTVVATDPQGNVYLYDENRGQIFRYDLSRARLP